MQEQKDSYNWVQMIAIGFAVLGIGFLIAIGGYLLTNVFAK